ncbi:hypothetical protein Tco_1352437 [Tanacetum coccineum]
MLEAVLHYALTFLSKILSFFTPTQDLDNKVRTYQLTSLPNQLKLAFHLKGVTNEDHVSFYFHDNKRIFIKKNSSEFEPVETFEDLPPDDYSSANIVTSFDPQTGIFLIIITGSLFCGKRVLADLVVTQADNFAPIIEILLGSEERENLGQKNAMEKAKETLQHSCRWMQLQKGEMLHVRKSQTFFSRTSSMAEKACEKSAVVSLFLTTSVIHELPQVPVLQALCFSASPTFPDCIVVEYRKRYSIWEGYVHAIVGIGSYWEMGLEVRSVHPSSH